MTSVRSRLAAIGLTTLGLAVVLGALLNAHRDPPELTTTVGRMHRLKTVLDERLERGPLPITLTELVTAHPPAERVPIQDSWRREMRLIRHSDRVYQLRSAGPDGVFGSSDDIVVDSRE